MDAAGQPGLLEVPDETLFARVANGEEAAFGAFYDRYEGLFFGVALRILRRESEAEDVLQEAAVLIWERAPAYNPKLGRPASWAVTLVRNKAIDRLRSTQRRNDLHERAAGELGDSLSGVAADSVALAADASAAVTRTLSRLPSEQREAIELAFFGGLSQGEIAERLAEPLGTIKARIRRGMLAMRDALEGVL